MAEMKPEKTRDTASKLPEEREIENVERTAKKIYNGAVKEYLMFEVGSRLPRWIFHDNAIGLLQGFATLNWQKMLKVMFGALTGLLTVLMRAIRCRAVDD